jgi:mono/diheme cytochrome c family protein
MRKSIVLGAVLAATAFGADESGQKEEARSCIACHSLRIVHSQRLTRAAWNRELDKMTGWGAKIGEREALLDYLVGNFGDDKMPPAAVMTPDGSAVAPQK